MESNLSKLLRTASGQIMLRSIAYNARRFAAHVKIVPYDGAMGRCNAYVETEPTAARKMAALVLFSPQTSTHSGPSASL